MNTKLIDSLVAIINSLNSEERRILEKKLFFDGSEANMEQIMQLAQTGSSFDFLYKEPDIYTLDDGESV